jgi:hypothetical protein
MYMMQAGVALLAQHHSAFVNNGILSAASV